MKEMNNKNKFNKKFTIHCIIRNFARNINFDYLDSPASAFGALDRVQNIKRVRGCTIV